MLGFQYYPGTTYLFIFAFIVLTQDYERAVIFRLGRMREDSLEKRGFFPLNHLVNKIETVDIRTKVFDIPQQEVISKDAVTIRVDAVVHYKVVNPMKAVNTVQNFNNTTVREMSIYMIIKKISGYSPKLICETLLGIKR